MKKYLLVLLVIIAFFPMLMTSCGGGSSSEVVSPQGHVITDKAELRRVSMELRPVSSGSSERIVVFSITLRNVTDTPLVYTVTAIIDDIAAGIGTIPDDEEGLLRVMPGQEYNDRVAVMYNMIPSNFVLYIDVAN